MYLCSAKENESSMKKNNEQHSIYFCTRDELTKVHLDDVMFATYDSNDIYPKFKSGRTLLLRASLRNFLQTVASIPGLHFERIGRSLIINTAYISHINAPRRTVILADDQMKVTIELMLSKEAIRQLKQTLFAYPRRDIHSFQTTSGNMEALQIMEEKVYKT